MECYLFLISTIYVYVCILWYCDTIILWYNCDSCVNEWVYVNTYTHTFTDESQLYYKSLVAYMLYNWYLKSIIKLYFCNSVVTKISDS